MSVVRHFELFSEGNKKGNKKGSGSKSGLLVPDTFSCSLRFQRFSPVRVLLFEVLKGLVLGAVELSVFVFVEMGK